MADRRRANGGAHLIKKIVSVALNLMRTLGRLLVTFILSGFGALLLVRLARSAVGHVSSATEHTPATRSPDSTTEPRSIQTAGLLPAHSVEPAQDETKAEVRWERRDVGFWPVAVFVAVSVALGAGHLALNWYFFKTEKPTVTEQELVTIERRARLPVQPRLEQLKRTADIATDRGTLMASDLVRLTEFGETEDEGFVHIPIEVAIEQVVTRLPVRASAEEDYRAEGLVTGGESNSGRVFRRQP
jgi:hypothetical protein